MKNDLVPIQVLGVIPTNRGCAVFVGNSDKTFTIYVETSVGQAIAYFMQEVPKERPLTHDLIGHIFKGLEVKVERVVINDLKDGTYFARLILKQENELGQKIIEVDARPSDCLALAIQSKSPIFVAKSVFAEVEDMTEVLKRLNEMEAGGSLEKPESETGSKPSHSNPNVDEPDPGEEPPESKK